MAAAATAARSSGTLPPAATARVAPGVVATCLGFPRMGANRQLKKLVEGFWSGKVSQPALLDGARELRAQHWRLQMDAGIAAGHIPCNDFSLYDHVLDTATMVGAIPPRYAAVAPGLETYFAMARGLQITPAAPGAITAVVSCGDSSSGCGGVDVAAMEMKKWFDTNYHFIVPELAQDQVFKLTHTKPLDEYLEAKALGIETRPVLLGPITFVLLSKPLVPSHATPGAATAAVTAPASGFAPLSLLPSLLPVYESLLQQLDSAGVQWVQFDEPALAVDYPPETGLAEALTAVYSRLTAFRFKTMVATYFDRADDNLTPLLSMPDGVDAVHVDLVRAPQQLDAVLAMLAQKSSMAVSLGVVDGRNVWKADLAKAVAMVRKAVKVLGGGRVMVAPSCSLLHCPHSLEAETDMDPEIKDWLAFSVQKLQEVATIAAATANPVDDAGSLGGSVGAELEANAASLLRRRNSPRIFRADVAAAMAAVGPPMFVRSAPFVQRQLAQRKRLQLPLFPTTTIGSFPQTLEVRGARAKLKKGEWSQSEYDAFMRKETEKCVRMQESLDLDVLVHGEFERTDMVEYFGEQLHGYVFTRNGWVQSYGSRCVKPPIIYGDVARTQPMTVEWSRFAQGLTAKPMKGMLTGPITCLQWSFVRDDQPRRTTAFQIALAVRAEVADLEAAGIPCIQIDEPAIREGLPLRSSDHESYLRWAVDAFLLSSAGAKPGTQVHTHMCYSDFGDILPAIQRMDADVLTVESSKSDLKLLSSLASHGGYANEIGPGLFDIHSPRVPSVEEMLSRLRAVLMVLGGDAKERVWVNPDCGLKTRGWKEVEAALANLVAVAKAVRADRSVF